MSSFGGLIKATSYFNRIQQKRDWAIIIKAIGRDIPEPDWNKSVKNIDKYMEDVCKKNGLNHLDFFAKG